MHGYITTNNQYCGPLSPTKAGAGIESVEEMSNPEQRFFTVFPNPTTGKFTVQLAGTETPGKIHVDIYRMQGEKVITNDFSGTRSLEFDLSELPAGIYFVRLVSGSQTETVKVIKQ
jgi:hypothetical protein